jgi:hypothetical protein
MLISRFEEIKMLDNETFGEFYTRINNLRNLMVSLENRVSDVKLIKKILRSMSKRFRIKVIAIEESKDLDFMKIEEFVRSLQTYEHSLPPVKKAKEMAFKATKSIVSPDEDSEEEDEVAMLAKNINKVMKTDKFIKRHRETPCEAEPEEDEKKDPRGPRCCECSGFRHLREDCRNLRQAKRKAFNATHSKSEEDETSDKDQKYLAFVAPHEEFEGSQSYYSKSSNKEREELKEAYGLLQETNQKNVKKLNNLKMEKGTLLQKITDLEDKLMEVQLHLEKFSDNKLAQM